MNAQQQWLDSLKADTDFQAAKPEEQRQFLIDTLPQYDPSVKGAAPKDVADYVDTALIPTLVGGVKSYADKADIEVPDTAPTQFMAPEPPQEQAPIEVPQQAQPVSVPQNNQPFQLPSFMQQIPGMVGNVGQQIQQAFVREALPNKPLTDITPWDLVAKSYGTLGGTGVASGAALETARLINGLTDLAHLGKPIPTGGLEDYVSQNYPVSGFVGQAAPYALGEGAAVKGLSMVPKGAQLLKTLTASPLRRILSGGALNAAEGFAVDPGEHGSRAENALLAGTLGAGIHGAGELLGKVVKQKASDSMPPSSGLRLYQERVPRQPNYRTANQGRPVGLREVNARIVDEATPGGSPPPASTAKERALERLARRRGGSTETPQGETITQDGKIEGTPTKVRRRMDNAKQDAQGTVKRLREKLKAKRQADQQKQWGQEQTEKFQRRMERKSDTPKKPNKKRGGKQTKKTWDEFTDEHQAKAESRRKEADRLKQVESRAKANNEKTLESLRDKVAKKKAGSPVEKFEKKYGPGTKSLKKKATAIHEKAKAFKQQFLDDLKQIADDAGLQYKPEYEQHAVKGTKRMVEKLKAGKSITDALRNTLVIEPGTKLKPLIKKLEKSFKEKGYKILEYENWYEDGTKGYKHIVYKLQHEGSPVIELQLNYPNMLKAKSQVRGHKLYEMIRALQEMPSRTPLQEENLNRALRINRRAYELAEKLDSSGSRASSGNSASTNRPSSTISRKSSSVSSKPSSKASSTVRSDAAKLPRSASRRSSGENLDSSNIGISSTNSIADGISDYKSFTANAVEQFKAGKTHRGRIKSAIDIERMAHYLSKEDFDDALSNMSQAEINRLGKELGC